MGQLATRPNSLAQLHGLFEDNPHSQNQQELELVQTPCPNNTHPHGPHNTLI